MATVDQQRSSRALMIDIETMSLRPAGHIRNRQMLFEGLPHLVVAFPGGRGTANMIENARKEGVKVWQPKGTRESPDCSSEDSASRKLP